MADEVEAGADAGDFDDFVDPPPAAADPASDAEDFVEDRPPTPPLGWEEGGTDMEVLQAAPGRSGKPGGRPATTEVFVLDPADHMTSDFLDPVEEAAVIATRAEQIPRTGDVFLPKGVRRRTDDPVGLAEQELECGCCPLTVRRERSHRHGVSVIEIRRVRDLLLLNGAEPN